MKNSSLMLFLSMFITLNVSAQDQSVEMADVMRSNGHIYVVVACVLLILLALIAYLFALDKRLNRLEK